MRPEPQASRETAPRKGSEGGASATRSTAATTVVFIVHTYPPVLGGTEIEAQRVAAALLRRGYEVQVLCAGGDPMPPRGEWTDSAGVPVRILTSRREGLFPALRFSAGVARYLLSHRRPGSVAYFLMPGLHLVAGVPLAVLMGYRVFMKFSGSNTIRPLLRSFAGRLELYWLRRWRVPVMLLNQGMLEEAVEAGISPAQALFMPNPVDVEAFSPVGSDPKEVLRRELGLDAKAFVVVYTGRLSPEKGLKELVTGFSLAHRRAPEMVLVLVGDGPERVELEALGTRLGVPSGRLRFTGRVNPDEIPRWLQAADAFALVSPNEGFSCALAEAMSCALPAVVSDIPANRQLVNDRGEGFTVPFGDVEAISRALCDLQGDAALRGSMGQAARERILRNYSMEQVISLYQELFGAPQGQTGEGAGTS